MTHVKTASQASPQIIASTCGSWHLRQTAKALEERNALAGLYISNANTTGIHPEKFHRCWPFHTAMKPFYHAPSPLRPYTEDLFWTFFPIWKNWFERQKLPRHDATLAIATYALEAFNHPDSKSALNVFDAPNSHPNTQERLVKKEYRKWLGAELPSSWHWYHPRGLRALEQADLILCPSTFVLESMIDNGVPASKCILSPFGVDLSLFSPSSQPSQGLHFICVGTLHLRKGHPYLFEAFAKLKKRLPNATLTCVGGIHRNMTRLIHKWKNLFTHIPHVDQTRLAELLQQSTAFVLPSIEEGYARAALEAMACGLPIIGTHESGITTDITHAKEGLIVPAADSEALFNAMEIFADQPALAQQLGQAATTRVASMPSWQDYGDRVLKAIQTPV